MATNLYDASLDDKEYYDVDFIFRLD